MAGSFDADDVHRKTKLEFSVGTQILGHLYEIDNNKDFHFTNKFEFELQTYILQGTRH